MHERTAQPRWEGKDAVFADRRYGRRAHPWRFDGAAEGPGSSSPLPPG